jgi:hypothetical protein
MLYTFDIIFLSITSLIRQQTKNNIDSSAGSQE